MASNRNPSKWYSVTQWTAFWTKYSRHGSLWSPSKFSASPQSVMWCGLKYSSANARM